MNVALAVGYEGAARLARALAAFAPSSDNKLVQSFASRRGVLSRFESFARDRARPLLWMHAPSVGEGLQARPVIDLMLERRPRTQLAYTYFSPSARAFAARLPVDFRDVLPFDATSDMRRALNALSPNALVFSKLDVWPTLAREASARGTRLGLVNATLARESSRRSWLAGAMLRDAYSRFDRVGAISAEDADRLIALGVPHGRVSVTGDTRFDQAWARARAVDLASSLLQPLASERPTLVAGSTWPADEEILLPAWRRLASRMPEARLIMHPSRRQAISRQSNVGPPARNCASRAWETPRQAVPMSSSSIASVCWATYTRSRRRRSSAGAFTQLACTPCSSPRRSVPPCCSVRSTKPVVMPAC